MIIVQIATALAIGAYVVLSKDSQRNRPDATPRESLRLKHPADHLDLDGRPVCGMDFRIRQTPLGIRTDR
jgi:hypothetical protein